jgi:hypothetical protein
MTASLLPCPSRISSGCSIRARRQGPVKRKGRPAVVRPSRMRKSTRSPSPYRATRRPRSISTGWWRSSRCPSSSTSEPTRSRPGPSSGCGGIGFRSASWWSSTAIPGWASRPCSWIWQPGSHVGDRCRTTGLLRQVVLAASQDAAALLVRIQGHDHLYAARAGAGQPLFQQSQSPSKASRKQTPGPETERATA